MKLVDVNILLYAYDLDSRWHAPARRWLEERLSGMAQPAALIGKRA